MNSTENNYKAYVYAVREQLEQYIEGLDALSSIISQRPLTFNERNAAERGLQVIIEAAIGCSKHYLKSKTKPIPSEARATIERVYEFLAITSPSIDIMRAAVGMRNAIIHDYLNLDWSKIEPVLAGRKYCEVRDYALTVSEYLLDI